VKPILSVREVSFSYATKTVLAGMNFDIFPGETVAIIGANGAGKTTLLKILCGLLKPSGGEVLLRDRPLRDHKPRELAKCIAMVPQDIQITFDFTVREFVEQGRTPYVSSFMGALQPADQAAIANAMEMADVHHLAHRKFSELSGGERQRVKVALALAQEPQLLLLDEPAQHLDIGRQAEVYSVLHRLNQTGLTIIAAIHDLHSVYTNFSLGLVMRPDLSFLYGPPASVLKADTLREVFGAHLPSAWLNGLPSSPRRVDLLEPEVDLKDNEHEQKHSN
jgi:iron complex transport system ATP-binding protein